jgi:uncharacterized protein YwlG (UPF0340 family)
MKDMEAGYFSDEIEKRDKVRAECLERGLHWARATVGTRSDGQVAQHMAEWIDEVEERERKEHAARAHELTERGVVAAESSAKSANASAASAAGSTRAAIASAVFAFFALVVSIAAYFKAT